MCVAKQNLKHQLVCQDLWASWGVQRDEGGEEKKERGGVGVKC